jgi:phosphatidylethanolamine/phosphatidyl-N-methylethanolamine N-methyltransferase
VRGFSDWSDHLLFLRAWAASPLAVAAIAPSGGALARLITAGVEPASAPVIELGAGTGAFTRALLERGVPEHRLVLVERRGDFARRLRQRFPQARVLDGDAAELREQHPLGEELAGAVVSGLPLLSMPQPLVTAILDGAFSQLREGGAFYQFTYGWRCPIPPATLEPLGLGAVRIGAAWANLPPAAVYRLARQQRQARPAPDGLRAWA